jgi:hypothetical protein
MTISSMTNGNRQSCEGVLVSWFYADDEEEEEDF